MRWTTPDFKEVCLNSEVTAYVNTDGALDADGERRASDEDSANDTSRATIA